MILYCYYVTYTARKLINGSAFILVQNIALANVAPSKTAWCGQYKIITSLYWVARRQKKNALYVESVDKLETV